ncbi:MAG TPA: FAD-dependent oxidoreductase, partial [Rhodospirillales bacterium]|nr:FAD-dependent oxidoreductase [Rhodospirillales bacterium]
MTEKIECAVIGAGVVGLAIARQLALAGREVLMIEQCDAIGTGISARNSEVIHAGIYYPQNSLKATLCVRGRNLLYDHLQERGLDHDRCGKLIVATDQNQIPDLQALDQKARANGITDL